MKRYNNRGSVENLPLLLIVSIILIIIVTIAYRAYLTIASSRAYSSSAVFLARGGSDDNSFNYLVNKGLMKVEHDLKISLNPKSFQNDEKSSEDISSIMKQKYDLLIGVGFENEELFQKLSKLYPKTDFVLIDSFINAKNVASLLFLEQEGGFLAGSFAAMLSNGKPIGFIGGMMIPPVERFADGYIEGAKYINPKIKVEVCYVGHDPKAFTDKVTAKKIAKKLYKKGINIIFQAAGGAGLGVIEAGKEAKKYVIGVDTNQSELAPDTVITSVEKRLDVVIFEFLKGCLQNGFKGGKHLFGLKENAIRLSPFDYSRFKIIKPEFEFKLKKIEEELKNDKISSIEKIERNQ